MAGLAESLQIAPNKMVFPVKEGEPAKCNITLQNPSDECIAFKVKTTAPKQYSVKPATGVLAPGAAAVLAVSMVPLTPQALLSLKSALSESKDRFLVEAMVVGAEVRQATSEQFRANPKAVSGTKIRVVLLKRAGAAPAGTPVQTPAAKPAAQASRPASQPQHPSEAKPANMPPPAPKDQKQLKASPAATVALDATPPSLARLPGLARLTKAGPSSLEPAAVPADVLAAFQTPAGVGSMAELEDEEEEKAVEVTDNAVAASAPRQPQQPAAVPDTKPSSIIPAVRPEPAKFSASLRKKMAELEQRQRQAKLQQGIQGDVPPRVTTTAMTVAAPPAAAPAAQSPAAAVAAAGAERSRASLGDAKTCGTSGAAVKLEQQPPAQVAPPHQQQAGDSPVAPAMASHLTELVPAVDTAATTLPGSRLRPEQPAAAAAVTSLAPQLPTGGGAATKRAGKGGRVSCLLVRAVPAAGGVVGGAGSCKLLAAAALSSPAAASGGAGALPQSEQAGRSVPQGAAGQEEGLEEPSGSVVEVAATEPSGVDAEGAKEEEMEVMVVQMVEGVRKEETMQDVGEEEEQESSEEESEEEMAGDASDSDFEMEEEEEDLLPQEIEVEMARQETKQQKQARRAAGGGTKAVVASPAPPMAARRRRSSAAAAPAPAVAAAAAAARTSGDSRMVEQEGNQRAPAHKGGGSSHPEVDHIDLLSSDSEEELLLQRRVQKQQQQPRTKGCAGAALPTLRLSFTTAAAAAGGPPSGQQQRLAVVRVRSCVQLQHVMEEVAARCLVNGGEGSISRLSFALGTLQLAPEHTVKQAGLQDGDCIHVAISGHVKT